MVLLTIRFIPYRWDCNLQPDGAVDGGVQDHPGDLTSLGSGVVKHAFMIGLLFGNVILSPTDGAPRKDSGLQDYTFGS